MEKVTHLLSESVVDNIARKVAEEPMEDFYGDWPTLRYDDPDYKVPQHVIDEAVADASRERTKELRQMEMYYDPDWNWSGFR